MRSCWQARLEAGGEAVDVELTDVSGHDQPADQSAVEACDPGAVDHRAVDVAYRDKYGRYPGPTAAITGGEARSATLRLTPRRSLDPAGPHRGERRSGSGAGPTSPGAGH